ncbi:SGNH hydrolase protein [Dioscorea alata]|uniref:SGNH hydrolase protein n=1 Tax=Dioscorea alata TaxID=55571 RepID=A0ACB7V9Y2_DIOAL|nr:SGNH hydrolase protein [Dioscorea alata]
MPFATTLLPHLRTGSTNGLVSCAVGGTVIKEWEQLEKLYEEMVRRFKEVAGEGEIKAVLWLVGVVSEEKLLDLLEIAMSSNTAKTVKRSRELMDSGVDPIALMYAY